MNDISTQPGQNQRQTGGESPLEFAQLVHRCMGRIELAERLLASFESRFPVDLSQVEKCLSEGDSTQLARLVHQMKGSAANISAPELHGIMCRMETAVRADQPGEAGACLQQVAGAWQRFRESKSAVRSQAKA
jgi:HPt (histidine-containing phosphotransfer) domain-containing protein